MLEKVYFGVIVISYIFITNTHALLDLNLESNRYPFDRQLYEDVLNPVLCQQQLTYLTTDAELLARFLDAGIRVPRGILTGNVIDLGNFHQCLAINEKADDILINGKYCRIRVPVEQNLGFAEFSDRSFIDPRNFNIDKSTARQLEAINNKKVYLNFGAPGGNIDTRIQPNSSLANINFELAICIPRPCSTEQAINGLFFNLTEIGFEYSDILCRLPDDRPWVTADYVATVVFSFIGFLTVISTCYDLYNSIYLKKGNQEIQSAYTSFSVYTNTRRLLSFNSSPGSLECLDGIRALAMVWVVLGHSFAAISTATNLIEAFEWTVSPQATWITLAPISVDTFFFLSGLLLVYTTAGKVGRMQLLKNLHIFYLNRLLRMFPILAAIILFESSFLMRVSDGPLWDIVAIRTLTCREFWWSTLIHLQNIINPLDACIGVSWYLAIDVQLHILSPIILFWVFTSKRAAWTALNTGLIATLTASTIFIFFKNLPSGVLSPTRPEDGTRYYKYYYVNTLTRASPFLVGMVYGYLLHLWRKKNIQVSKMLTSISLLFSLLTMLVILYCSYIAMRMDWDNQLADNFFNSFLRPLWALALGWIVFACVQGRAEPINWFLSLRMWKLPSRISYAMYLIHFTMMAAFYSSIIEPINFRVSYVFFNFMGFMFLTIILSFIVTLLIDSPFSTIFKLLLGGIKKSQSSEVTTRGHQPTNKRNHTAEINLTGENNENHQKISNVSDIGDLKVNITEEASSSLTEREPKSKDN